MINFLIQNTHTCQNIIFIIKSCITKYGYYILSTLQKFRPRNFNKAGKMIKKWIMMVKGIDIKS